MMANLHPIAHLSTEEIDVLMVAAARGVDHTSTATDAWEAAEVIWRNREVAGRVLCSLATMFAEARA